MLNALSYQAGSFSQGRGEGPPGTIAKILWSIGTNPGVNDNSASDIQIAQLMFDCASFAFAK